MENKDPGTGNHGNKRKKKQKRKQINQSQNDKKCQDHESEPAVNQKQKPGPATNEKPDAERDETMLLGPLTPIPETPDSGLITHWMDTIRKNMSRNQSNVE